MTRAAPLRSRATTRDRAFAAALVVLLPLWNGVVVGWVPSRAYVVVNLGAAAALLALARWSGLSWAALGLSRDRAASGLRWGGAAFGLVAVGLAVAVVVPVLRPLLADARAAERDVADLAGEILVRIPLGTVLWEEVAFRGVLLAALVRVLPVGRAVAVAAVVFGVWHIRPTLSGLAANDLADAAWLHVLLVVGVCAFTACAGVVLSWLRLRSGSLLAPALLHLATNTLGTVAAAAVHRLG